MSDGENTQTCYMCKKPVKKDERCENEWCRREMKIWTEDIPKIFDYTTIAFVVMIFTLVGICIGKEYL